MAMTRSSSSSSFAYQGTYDVFLNFRGDDTRNGFTGHLYKALCESGFNTFMDDKELKKGEEITSALIDAIKESKIAIVIFSKDYASSTFCLEELAMILEGDGQVFPVFYHVNPSDVRHQKGSYAEALKKHEERIRGKRKVKRWRSALREAADINGWHLSKERNKYEYEIIREIVQEVCEEIEDSRSWVNNYRTVCSKSCVRKSMPDFPVMRGPSFHISVFHTLPSAPGYVGAPPPPFPPQVMHMVQQSIPPSYHSSPMCIPDKYHSLTFSFNALNLGPHSANGYLPNDEDDDEVDDELDDEADDEDDDEVDDELDDEDDDEVDDELDDEAEDSKTDSMQVWNRVPHSNNSRPRSL